MASDPQAVIDSVSCYACLSDGEQNLIALGLLQQKLLAENPMADTSPTALLEAAKCYECAGVGEQRLIALGLLKGIVLANNPGADTSPDGLMAAAQCYACDPGMWKLFGLGLLAEM